MKTIDNRQFEAPTKANSRIRRLAGRSGSTSQQPAVPVSSTSQQPAVPGGSTSRQYQSAVPVGNTSQQPAVPVGSTSQQAAVSGFYLRRRVKLEFRFR